jgi:catechol 2,3-dioxygenase-like lactoylglutathione lyase family enzyme
MQGNPSQGVGTVLSDRVEIEAHLGGFRQGIASGARGVVLSSAVFPAFGGSANLSPDVLHLLREDLGFTGLVMTLDLDHPACLGGMQMPDVCLQALAVGADLLLISPQGARQIPQIARAIARAVETGTLPLSRLTDATAQVRRFAPLSGDIHEPSVPFDLLGFDHIVFYVDHMTKALDFYGRVPGIFLSRHLDGATLAQCQAHRPVISEAPRSRCRPPKGAARAECRSPLHRNRPDRPHQAAGPYAGRRRLTAAPAAYLLHPRPFRQKVQAEVPCRLS